jgi:hypothetical protein
VARKDHRRDAVKKAVNSRQRTFETLAQSVSRMDVDYNFELAEAPELDARPGLQSSISLEGSGGVC